MTDRLRGDAARDATPSIGGYAYQLWWSLYAWCRLRTGESLYLEGAEDIDLLRPGSAETIQVKHSSRRVTLASADVLDALGHWWENQRRNPEHTVHLRLITTAEVAVERGAPFGEAAGIRYWEEHAKRPGSNLKPIRDFLSAHTHVPEELRRFIADVPDDVLRQHFIARISWDTGSASRLDVRAQVEHELIELVADLFHLPPDDARRTISHLLDHVLETVLRRDRTPLVRADLLDALEQLLTDRVPRAEIRALRSLATAPATAVVIPPSKDSHLLVGGMTELDEIRRVPSGFIDRHALTLRLVELLASSGTLVLKGSTGMGKSTLARLVGLTIDGRWRRVDLRGRKPAEIRDILLRALSILRQSHALAGIVIDDLNLEQEPHVYENALIAFLALCRVSHWNVIITTHLDLPSRVLAECEITNLASTTVPPLDQDDLRELVVRHGCPTGDRADNWAKVIHATTSGHPLLAHARTRRLQEAGWPSDDPSLWERITDRTDLATVQREARQRLTDYLPAEARTLAYRLSVFSSVFRREHALRVAKVPAAGEFFDRLCGPWVEDASAGYFRLSPLLRHIGADVLGAALAARQK